MAKKNRVNSLENNFQVKYKRPMFDIVNVVLCSFSNGSITPSQSVDLCPTCHTGFCTMPFQVSRHLIFEFLNKGTGAPDADQQRSCRL